MTGIDPAADRANGAVRTRLRRVAGWRPPVDPIPLLIAVAGGLVLAHRLAPVSDWHVMTDEMLYPKVAFGVLEGHLFPGWVRGTPAGVKNVLFPILIAPLLATMRMPDAHGAIITLNAFLFASAAIPAFLIAKKVMSRWAAYLVALMVIAVPWAVQAGNILTEATAYAAFVWAIWGMHRCLVDRGVRGDLIGFGTLLLAYSARTQFVVLVPLLPIAVLLHELSMGMAERMPGRSRFAGLRLGAATAWRHHRLLGVACALGGVYVLARGLDGVLGSYAITAGGSLLPPGTVAAVWPFIASIAIGSGVVTLAFALGWILDELRSGGPRPSHALAILVLLVLPVISVGATSFAIQFSEGYQQERYLFYIAPLILLGFGAFFARRRPLPIALAGAAAAGYVLTRSTYSGGLLIPFASPEAALYPVFHGRSAQLAGFVGWSPSLTTFLWVTVFAVAVIGTVSLRHVGPRVFAVVGSLGVLGLIAQLDYLLPRVIPALERPPSILGHQEPDERDWVDQATSEDDSVGVIDSAVNARGGVGFYSPYFDRVVHWSVEFWNKRIESVWGIDGTGLMLQPAGVATVDPQDGTVTMVGQRPVNHVVMSASDVRFAPQGPVVARRDVLNLYRVSWPMRAGWVTSGIGADGWTADGTPAIVRVFGDPAASPRLVALTVTGYAGGDIPGGRSVTLQFGGDRDRIHIGTSAQLHAQACVGPGETVDAQVVPHGASPLDARTVGIRVIQIEATPGRPC